MQYFTADSRFLKGPFKIRNAKVYDFDPTNHVVTHRNAERLEPPVLRNTKSFDPPLIQKWKCNCIILYSFLSIDNTLVNRRQLKTTNKRSFYKHSIVQYKIKQEEVRLRVTSDFTI